MIDGQNIQEVKQKSLRGVIGVVPQVESVRVFERVEASRN